MPRGVIALVFVVLLGMILFAILWRWVIGLRRSGRRERRRSGRAATGQSAPAGDSVRVSIDARAGTVAQSPPAKPTPRSAAATERWKGPANKPDVAARSTAAAAAAPARSGLLGPPSNPVPQWLGASDSITVGDLVLDGPMTWCVRSRRVQTAAPPEPSAILLGLPVEPLPVRGPWPDAPSYATLDAGRRYRYLAWLAAGRRQPPADPAMLVLFLMGLERRALVDRQDDTWLFAELLRLRRLAVAPERAGQPTGEGSRAGAAEPAIERQRSVNRARVLRTATHLLWYITATRPDRLGLDQVHDLVRATITWSDESLAAALAWFATNQQPLPPWMAFVVAGETKHARRSVVVTEHRETLRELFTERYREKWPGGLATEPAKRPFVAAFQPLNPTLHPERREVPNPLGRASQFRPLADLWNAAIDDLRPYRRAVQRQMSDGTGGPGSGADSRVAVTAAGPGEDLLTVDAWNALPAELRRRTEHPLSEPLGRLMAGPVSPIRPAADPTGATAATDNSAAASFDSVTGSNAVAVLRTGEIAALIPVELRPRLTRRQSERLAEAVEDAGYAIEPDPRITGQALGWDEQIALFFRVSEAAARPDPYLAAGCLMRLGYAIAAADGRADDAELSLVVQHLDEAFDLNPHEARRIDALRWLLTRDATSADVVRIGRQLQRTIASTAARLQIGRLLVSVAAADEEVTADEERMLRQAFRALDLDDARLDEILAQFRRPDQPEAEAAPSRASDAPVATALAWTVTEEERSTEPDQDAPDGPVVTVVKPPPLVLDRALIASIMQESREVAAMLAEAMRVDADHTDDEAADDDNVQRGKDLAAPRAAGLPGVRSIERTSATLPSEDRLADARPADAPPTDAAPAEAGWSDNTEPADAAMARDGVNPPPATPADGARAAGGRVDPNAPTPGHVSEADPEHQPLGPPPPAAGPSIADHVPRPGGRYDAFYLQLLAQESWPLAEAHALARTHGHMLAGAVEAINDWAFDALGDALVIEEGDGLTIERDLLPPSSH